MWSGGSNPFANTFADEEQDPVVEEEGLGEATEGNDDGGNDDLKRGHTQEAHSDEVGDEMEGDEEEEGEEGEEQDWDDEGGEEDEGAEEAEEGFERGDDDEEEEVSEHDDYGNRQGESVSVPPAEAISPPTETIPLFPTSPPTTQAAINPFSSSFPPKSLPTAIADDSAIAAPASHIASLMLGAKRLREDGREEEEGNGQGGSAPSYIPNSQSKFGDDAQTVEVALQSNRSTDLGTADLLLPTSTAPPTLPSPTTFALKSGINTSGAANSEHKRTNDYKQWRRACRMRGVFLDLPNTAILTLGSSNDGRTPPLDTPFTRWITDRDVASGAAPTRVVTSSDVDECVKSMLLSYFRTPVADDINSLTRAALILANNRRGDLNTPSL